MTSPGGAERGRISVRVLPDTSAFARSLDRYLQRVERTLRVELPTVLDTSSLDRELRAAVATATKTKIELPASVDATRVEESTRKAKEKVTKGAPAKLPVEAENPIDAQFRTRVRREIERLTTDVEARIPVGVDGDALRAKLGVQIAALQKSLSVQIPIDPAKARDLRAKIATQVRAVEALVPPVEVKVEPEIEQGKLAALRAQLEITRAKLDGKRVDFDVGIDRSSLAALSQQIATLGAALSVAGLGALGGTAAAGGALALASAVASAAGAIALLPAVGAAGAAALGSLVIGFQGVGEAIKAAGDPAKFAEALKNLSPEARETAIAFKQLAPAATELRQAVQDDLFRDIAEQIRPVAERYLPTLQRGFSGTATEINKAAKSFTQVLLAPKSLADTGAIFTNVNLAFKQLTPVGASLGNALRDIAAVGSSFLPKLAEGFAGAADNFARFIEGARNSGALEQFIQNALTSLGQLFAILRNIGSTIGSVFQAGAASGNGFLSIVKDVTGQFAAFAKSAEGQQSFATFFAAARQAAEALAPVLGALVQVFASDLAPILADIGTAIGPSVTIFLQAIGEALRAAGPGLAQFAAGFGKFLEGIAPALPAIGRLAGVLGETLGRVLEEIGPSLARVAEVLADALSEALSDPDLIQGLISLGEAFGDIVVALAPVLPDLAMLAGEILQVLADVLKQIAPYLGPLVRAFVNALAPVLPGLADAFARLAVALAPIAADLALRFLELMEALLPVLPPLVEALAGIVEIAGPVLGFFISLSSVALNPIGSLMDLGAALAEFYEYAASGFEDVDKRLKGSLESQAAAFQQHTGSIGVALDDLLGGYRDTATGVEAELLRFAVSAAATEAQTKESFRLIAADVDGSVKTIIGALVFGRDTAGAIGAGTSRAYSAGLDVGLSAAEASARVAVSRVIAQLNSAADSAGGAGLRLAQGFAAGIAGSTALAAVGAAADRLMQSASRRFPSSPAKEGPFSGRGWTPYRGQALAEGFAEGMLDRVQAVRAASQQVMSAAAGALVSPAVVGSGGGGPVTNIYTQPGQSELAIVAMTERRQAWNARTS